MKKNTVVIFTSQLIKDSEPVEYGQALFKIKEQ